jgi:hypothetical protein
MKSPSSVISPVQCGNGVDRNVYCETLEGQLHRRKRSEDHFRSLTFPYLEIQMGFILIIKNTSIRGWRYNLSDKSACLVSIKT